MTQRQTWRRRDGGREEEEEEKNLPWHPLTYFSTKSEGKQAPGAGAEALSHNRTLQPLQEHLFPGCLPCYFSAANRRKPRSDQLSRDRICTLGWIQRQRTERYPLEGILRAWVSVQQRMRKRRDLLWCTSLCLFLLRSSSSWQSLFIFQLFSLLFRLIWLSNF